MFELSPDGVEFVKKEMTRYETKRSAIIPCLFRVQKENGGWVSSESVAYLAELMDVPEKWVQEVSTFYTMFNQKPVGKYHVQVCCNISCSMGGGRELAANLSKSLGVEEGAVSSDGRYTISRVECLGSCGTAPMMQVNDDYYENLTVDKAVKILRELD
ncbi:MAG: NAD(P)H-dependent oxidoreductase subunit E [Bdellovibrionaceae bacterium]|nr:NAD(P)H-dependent oxidoreductase subunit E [Bdellovibrionales bacterium]MCB9084716.1 NAD(P)H-dependent oxidoreductase subunit E [Pseudobdellovibrionaceae bacterium]